MPTLAVQVFGADIVAAAFLGCARDTQPTIQDELMDVALKVRDTAKSKISRYQGASLSTIHAVPRESGVWVVQDATKVTGRRGDFGSLQMRKGFIPALAEHESQILMAAMEATVRIAKEGGF